MTYLLSLILGTHEGIIVSTSHFPDGSIHIFFFLFCLVEVVLFFEIGEVLCDLVILTKCCPDVVELLN